MHLCYCARQRRISASHISGSVQTSAASPRRGSATVKTTAVMSLTKTPLTAPAEPVDPDNSSAGTAAASHRAGNVTWTTTAVTTRMSPWMSAVSELFDRNEMQNKCFVVNCHSCHEIEIFNTSLAVFCIAQTCVVVCSGSGVQM